jgi:hypothetical protein
MILLNGIYYKTKINKFYKILINIEEHKKYLFFYNPYRKDQYSYKKYYAYY